MRPPRMDAASWRLSQRKRLGWPDCWPDGLQCPNRCAHAWWQRTMTNHVHLTGPWAGWRLAGRDLVSPAGERVQPQVLDRWLAGRDLFDWRRGWRKA